MQNYGTNILIESRQIKNAKKKKKITHMKIVIFIIILYTKLLLLTNIYLRDYLLKNLLTLKLQ